MCWRMSHSFGDWRDGNPMKSVDIALTGEELRAV